MRKPWATVQIPPEAMPKEEIAHYDSFAGGFDSRDAQEDLPDGVSPDMRDMEVTHQDRLIRAPGVATIETVEHQPKQMFLHAGPSFSSELLLIAAPRLGIYTSGSVEWQVSADLLSGVYSFANYAGVALMSQGPGKLLFREAKGELGVIDGAPGGFAVGVFANRVLLGGTEFNGGNVDLMRVVWNDAKGDYRSWSLDDGAGDQILIGSSRARADRIQAFAYLGFNTLVVVCRRSLWIGQPTGDTFQPIKFEPRLEDTGCSYSQTVISTEFGVIFLSDDGVRLFDGNSAPVISDAINGQLIPTLDSDGRYSASFDPARKRYYLHTPTATWVLDMLKRRWFRWCTSVRCGAFFPTQAPDEVRTWATAVGNWGDQTGAWWQLGSIELGTGAPHFVRGYKLGFEDPTIETAFDDAIIPRWRSARRVQDNQDRLITCLGARITYEADAASQVEIQLPAMGSGDFEPVITADLTFGASLKQTRHAYIPFVHSGRGLGFGFRIVSGKPRLRKASLIWQDNGEQLGEVADIVIDDCPPLPPDDPDDIIPASITIAPAAETIFAHVGTVPMTAVVRNSVGEVISWAALTWETDDATVCTVTPTGDLTALVTAGDVLDTTQVRARITVPAPVVSNDAAITVEDEYVVHSFGPGVPYVFSDSFAVTELNDGDHEIRVLLVGGGGAGGSVDGSGVAAGGGGAGGMIDTTQTLSAIGAYPVGIGSGGATNHADHTIGVGSASGNKGTDSTFNGLRAYAGGAGLSNDSALLSVTGSGGSGGGQRSTQQDDAFPSGTATYGPGGNEVAGQGHKGGGGVDDPNGSGFFSYGGGGGGAGTAGQGTANPPGPPHAVGLGGNGLQSDIRTGVAVYYAGGGGGGYINGGPGLSGAAGGLGGGGHGGQLGAGTDGLGAGGGGGSGTLFQDGGRGGHGIVVIRYKRSSGIVATGGTVTTYPV